jgi:hypothetical protein
VRFAIRGSSRLGNPVCDVVLEILGWRGGRLGLRLRLGGCVRRLRWLLMLGGAHHRGCSTSDSKADQWLAETLEKVASAAAGRRPIG